jgi:hypothetical protein
MEVDEEESKKDGAPKMSKKEKRAQAKYHDVKKQMLEMAQTLERWGYKWDSVAIDGNTPLALAVSCRNQVLIEWLLERGADIVTNIL